MAPRTRYYYGSYCPSYNPSCNGISTRSPACFAHTGLIGKVDSRGAYNTRLAMIFVIIVCSFLVIISAFRYAMSSSKNRKNSRLLLCLALPCTLASCAFLVLQLLATQYLRYCTKPPQNGSWVGWLVGAALLGAVTPAAAVDTAMFATMSVVGNQERGLFSMSWSFTSVSRCWRRYYSHSRLGTGCIIL